MVADLGMKLWPHSTGKLWLENSGHLKNISSATLLQAKGGHPELEKVTHLI
jgi:hypothetical protein